MRSRRERLKEEACPTSDEVEVAEVAMEARGEVAVAVAAAAF